MELSITIRGKTWPARYSLRAAMAVEDKYGSVKKALFEQTTEPASNQIRARIYVLHEVLKAGKVWAELEEGRKAEEPPSEEQLLDMIPAAKEGEIMEQLIRVINDDGRTDFEAKDPEDPDGKNPQAT